MDDDDFRRGRPTCHKVFGEALAVLAGDALLNLSYEALVQIKTEPKKKAVVLASFASAVGMGGVLGGQVWDIEAEGVEISPAALHQIHLRKTASLITASLRMGGELAGARAQRLESLDRFGRQLGLLFQLADDLLNVEASAKVLGRPTGGDERLRKATYPRLLGSERSHERLKRLVAAGRVHARELGPWSPLFEDLVVSVARRVPTVRLKEEA
jgi:geranylgeranyl diphosphate synthase type II